MKRFATSLFAVFTLTSCVSVSRDAGLNEVQESVARRGAPAVEWHAEPLTADHDRVASLLADTLTADEAVAIAMINSPRLQVTLAELGIARAELIEASTVSNPIFHFAHICSRSAASCSGSTSSSTNSGMWCEIFSGAPAMSPTAVAAAWSGEVSTLEPVRKAWR